MIWIPVGIAAAIALLALHDLLQKQHTITRNFPVVGHLRFLMESIGPGLRQYIVAHNDEELPFSRDRRRWIYATSKKENNYFGFGTDNDLEASPNYIVVKNSAFPIAGDAHDEEWSIPCAKILGGHRNRARQFRPSSVINVSGMSWGSLGRVRLRH